ncbi:MAG: hypothetical protein J1G07_06505 [Clostridiales bacterium]|nr:hypothetical protein [Clostridiales bacterium]
MNKIKVFFQTLRDYICFPFCLIIDRYYDKKFIEELITQKDVDFLKSVGVDIDLNILKKSQKIIINTQN